jgi:hypothetical protein
LHRLCVQELIPKRQLPEMVVDASQNTSEANNPRSRLRRSNASMMRDVPSTRLIENLFCFQKALTAELLQRWLLRSSGPAPKWMGAKSTEHGATLRPASRNVQEAVNGV